MKAIVGPAFAFCICMIFDLFLLKCRGSRGAFLWLRVCMRVLCAPSAALGFSTLGLV